MKIAIVGEAWGEHEERQRSPFVGPSGYELTKMLTEAGIARADCYLTNVFNLRPKPSNDIENLCAAKSDAGAGAQLPPLKAGKYIRPEYLPELTRLYSELSDLRPNIIIALGNTAAWALLRNAGISKIRGAITESPVLTRRKVLPTYHPAAILRQWDLRHVTVLDLMKAKRESEYPEIRRPKRTVFIEPSLADMEWFKTTYLDTAKMISFDIETIGDQIDCIGFGPSAEVAMCIPFIDKRKPNGNYWPTLGEESAAWDFTRRVLGMPQPKCGQNTLYDIHFLWRTYGMFPTNYTDDTMLLHHALHPESEKGLGFLGSVYTDEASWKLMRTRGKTTIKRDE